MKVRSAALAFAVAGVLGSSESLAQNAYITNATLNSVSVIDTTKNAVIATIPVGPVPEAVGRARTAAAFTSGTATAPSRLSTVRPTQ
jgi:YVTN family beta-propeller protein